MTRTGRVIRAVISGVVLTIGWTAAAQAQAPPDAGPRLWTVVASVERPGTAGPVRPGLRADGRGLVRWVAETAGWGSDRVLDLNDDGVRRHGRPEDRSGPLLPIKENLDWAVGPWLRERVQPGDVVLLWFAGRAASIKGGEVLLPFDARATDLAGTGWSPDRAIENLIRDRKCAAVFCWIDAPFVAPAGPTAGEWMVNRLTRWPGASVWFSTGDRTAATGRGSAFAAALRAALGESPRTVLKTLATLDQDPAMQGVRFRQQGGFSAELVLYRKGLKAPRTQRAELLVQKGHAKRVTALAVRADGRILATASDDSTIRLWRVTERTHALLRVLPEFLNSVTALAFSQDGRYLAGGDGMGTVLVWDLDAPESRPIAASGPKPHSGAIEALVFLRDESPDEPASRRLVSLGQDLRCVVWDLADQTLRHAAQPLLSGALRISAARRTGGPAALVVVSVDGRLHGFDRAARPIGSPFPVPTGGPTALTLSSAGQWAAVGTDAGLVSLIDLVDRSTLPVGSSAFPGPITVVRLGPGSLVAVGTGEGMYLVRLDVPGPLKKLDGLSGKVTSVEFAGSGDWMAACTDFGNMALWRLDEHQPPSLETPPPIPDQPGTHVSCLAFGPPSAAPLLVAGEKEGGVRRFDLRTPKEYPRLAPHRGMVRRLAASRDGRYLLQITDEDIAQLWDLQLGREVRTFNGLYTGGTFLDNDRLVLARHANNGGGLVLIDRVNGRAIPGWTFAAPPGGVKEFALVLASQDGRRVVAAPPRGSAEEAYVWEAPGGTPRVVAGHDLAISAIDLTPDGRFLLTASEDGTVKVWDLSAGDLGTPVAVLPQANVVAMTAARFSPARPTRIVAAGTTASEDSLVFVWDWSPAPAARPVQLGRLPSHARAVSFVTNGRYIVAAGDHRRLRIWEARADRSFPELERILVDPGVDPEVARTRNVHHHSERINDLLAWPLPEASTVVSASDDTTIRFWKIDPVTSTASLLGTLTSAPDGAGSGLEPQKLASDALDAPWVAFTPEGVYDGSQEGDQLVSFVRGQQVNPLNQYAGQLFFPLLTAQLRQGKRPVAKKHSPPPPVLLEAPEDLDPARPQVQLTVTLGDPALRGDNLRLFQNDVPVRSGDGFRPTSRAGEYVVDVQLARGDNRLYVLAGRPSDVDARSGDITLLHTGPDQPGRMHVLALGVSKYKRNALEYPHSDASDIADYLQKHGIGSGRTEGTKVTLVNDEVNAKALEDAFDRVRRGVRGHPEDTVVVFLAGHTDVLAARGGEPRFSLLLPDFPFPETDPQRAVVRGLNLAEKVVEPRPSDYLTYSTIYRQLTRLDALQRLVIVDACQAEAILDDPGVNAVKQLEVMDREARQTRTAYFLASRRGEAAEESSVLKHGLLTYVLLRGMGAQGLATAPADLVALRDSPNADRDGDGRVTTRELRRYVDQFLPELASRMTGSLRAARPEVVARGGSAAPPVVPTHLQGGGASFPIVIVPSATTPR